MMNEVLVRMGEKREVIGEKIVRWGNEGGKEWG